MKKIVFENIFNLEKFLCPEENLQKVETIDGIEFLRVTRDRSEKICLMRKDYLRQIEERNE